jgi:hypothetical protein
MRKNSSISLHLYLLGRRIALPVLESTQFCCHIQFGYLGSGRKWGVVAAGSERKLSILNMAKAISSQDLLEEGRVG